MPNKEELLQSIHPDMKLNKAFFLKIYGYEITWPGFMNIAIKKLEDSGCAKASEYYRKVVEDYLTLRNEKWNNYIGKTGDEKRKQKIIQDLLQKNDKELLNLLQNMN